MEDACGQLLALKVLVGASAALASPLATSEGRVMADRCTLGARWPDGPISAALSGKVSGLIRRGLSNPDATKSARQLRAGLHEVRSAT